MNCIFLISMPDSDLVFPAVIGLILSVAVLYWVIANATRASARTDYEWAQLEFLAKIARTQGVPEQEIQDTFKAINPNARNK
jgi:hypothetical protein